MGNRLLLDGVENIGETARIDFLVIAQPVMLLCSGLT